MLKFRKVSTKIIGIVFTVLLLAQPATALAADSTNDTVNSIDKGISGLEYDKYEVLANKGDSIDTVIPKEGSMNDGKFVVVERTKKSLGTSPVDISVVDSIMDRTYPGALLLANDDYARNRPTSLVAPRDPINITIDLPGLGDDNTVTVDNPTYGSVSAAIDKLVNKWSDTSSDTHTLPARTQYSESMVYSKHQLTMGLNIDINVVEPLLGINFEAITKGEETYMVASYKQIFYTVSAETPSKPSDLFRDDVTYKDLKKKGVSDSSPPVMVSNVSYGRTIYVVLKTDSHSEKVESAFKALIKGQNIEGHEDFEHIINNSSFTVVVMGGDAQEHHKIITTDFNEIRNVIKDNATFSLKNPGYPVSYTGSFIKDNSLAAVHNYTDYVETKSAIFERAKLTLDHSGGYVADFYVSWDEVSYDENGKEVLNHKEWEGNGSNRTAHYNTTINLPANARNICVKARECTGLAWDWWRTVVDEVNLPLANLTVAIWGTTLYPHSSINPS